MGVVYQIEGYIDKISQRGPAPLLNSIVRTLDHSNFIKKCRIVYIDIGSGYANYCLLALSRKLSDNYHSIYF